MYTITIVTHFSAAHNLRNYKGKCESLHGHNWRVEVIAASDNLNETGMVMDFCELKTITYKVLEKLDHAYLNDITYFSSEKQQDAKNPSSEEIARFIYNELKPAIAARHCRLKEIRVWETENSCASYSEGCPQ